jgi:hypothetical protein
MHGLSKSGTELLYIRINVKDQEDRVCWSNFYHFSGIQFKQGFTQFMTGFCQSGKGSPEILIKTC